MDLMLKVNLKVNILNYLYFYSWHNEYIDVEVNILALKLTHLIILT